MHGFFRALILVGPAIEQNLAKHFAALAIAPASASLQANVQETKDGVFRLQPKAAGLMDAVANQGNHRVAIQPRLRVMLAKVSFGQILEGIEGRSFERLYVLGS